MNRRKYNFILGTLIALSVWIFGIACGMSINPPRPNHPIAPAGYNIKVSDADDNWYYTNAFNFDEAHKCIIFADSGSVHRVICGNYKMEGVNGGQNTNSI